VFFFIWDDARAFSRSFITRERMCLHFLEAFRSALRIKVKCECLLVYKMESGFLFSEEYFSCP
jgi:hypothetical protein